MGRVTCPLEAGWAGARPSHIVLPSPSALTNSWGPLPPQHRPGTGASAQEMLTEDKASHTGEGNSLLQKTGYVLSAPDTVSFS